MQLTTQNTFSNNDLAFNYGTTLPSLANIKRNHADELVEGIHYFKTYEQTKGGRQEVIRWTLKGVVVLGFFIRSPKAKAFRIWASNELEKQLLKEAQELASARTKLSELTQKQEKHRYEIAGYKSQIAQHNARLKALECEVLELQSKQVDESHFKYIKAERDYFLSKCEQLKKDAHANRNKVFDYLAKINEQLSEIYTANGAVMAFLQGDEHFIKNHKILN